MKFFYFIFTLAFIMGIFSCSQKEEPKMHDNEFNISEEIINSTVAELVDEHGDEFKSRIEKGVAQTASLWKLQDGTTEQFMVFCKENFVSEPEKLNDLFKTIERNEEILTGYFNRITFDLKVPVDEDLGEPNSLDKRYASYDASSHLTEDMFDSKIAHVITLNFPFYSLDEKNDLSQNWNRKDWAKARAGDIFTSRVPANLKRKYYEVNSAASSYISEYNIYMGYVVDENMEPLFPEDMKLISHWNLRDELKSNYSDPNGLKKQEMIHKVMQRIINQDIPKKVINNNEYKWDPFENKVYKEGDTVAFEKEGVRRYTYLLSQFKALKDIDNFTPQFPTYIKRKFEQEMEMSFETVEKLFTDLISSPVRNDVAAIIKKRLGRDLKPFDIWYDGFKTRSMINEEELSEKTHSIYPTAKAFDDDLPNILTKLNFSSDQANYLGKHIEVDNARGAGHAWGAEMQGQKSHLRTRLPEGGMDYKGFNIAIHELGHNVEQTYSLYDIDHYLLNGVPNNAFTEAMAFIFQSRDLKILGRSVDDPDKEHLDVLDNFWSAYEIMGVALVDMKVWQWLYENPEANPEQLKENVIRIAKEVWNMYYADVFGVKDSEILAVYSHQISYPLYLPAYPIGKIIEFQIENQIESAGGEEAFGAEVERMCTIGRILPQTWMKQATGSELSVQPFIDAAEEAAGELE